VTSPILTRHKWMLKAHGRHIVVVKNTLEKFEHPLMKALIWALYLPEYPAATVEVGADDRYKPDVVAFAPDNPRFRDNEPVFWGEAGSVGRDKVAALVKRYPDTHFALAKWDTRLKRPSDMVKEALKGIRRNAPFDVINFPVHSADFIDDDGNITLTHDDVTWMRL
jgi:hypothetical protein